LLRKPTFVIDYIILPRSFANAGDLAFIGEVAEAYTADAVVTQICVRTTAYFAAVIAAG